MQVKMFWGVSNHYVCLCVLDTSRIFLPCNLSWKDLLGFGGIKHQHLTLIAHDVILKHLLLRGHLLLLIKDILVKLHRWEEGWREHFSFRLFKNKLYICWDLIRDCEYVGGRSSKIRILIREPILCISSLPYCSSLSFIP